MTGIYGNSQEDKYRERELDRYLNERQALDDADEKEEAENNYKFPEYLNINEKFMLLVRLMKYEELSSFIHFVSIMADEKNSVDERHWASDELNVFLNKMVKDRGAK